MLSMLRQILVFEMTIAEWIGTAILALIPYVVVGVIWSATHTDGLGALSGVERAASVLGSILGWPVLLFSDVCVGA